MRRYFWLLAVLLAYPVSVYAGYFEFSVNGSYFKKNNGLINGAYSTSTIQRLGAGINYHLTEVTSLELSYMNSKTMDVFNQDIPTIVNPVTTTRNSTLDNVSLDLIQEFASKGSAFRPFVKGGFGYMIRSTSVAGETLSPASNKIIPLDLGKGSTSKSMSAEGGIGMKIFISSSTALEFAYTVYATELDQPEIFLHYSLSGGLRFIF